MRDEMVGEGIANMLNRGKDPTAGRSAEQAPAGQARPYEIGLHERLRSIEYCHAYLLASADDGGPEAIRMALDDILSAQLSTTRSQLAALQAVLDAVKLAGVFQSARKAALEVQLSTTREIARELAAALDNSLTKPYFSCCSNGPCDECRIAVKALTSARAAGLLDDRSAEATERKS